MKNALRSRISRTFCVCVFLAVLPSAFAVPMTGDITIVGDPFIKNDSGDFATFAPVGSVVTFKKFWGFLKSDPAFSWTVNGFTFGLTSSTVDSNTPKSVTATGTGMVGGNGFDPTAGDWTLSVGKRTGFVFTFTALAAPPPTPAVPDSGSTFGLLALALAALVGASRLRPT